MSYTAIPREVEDFLEIIKIKQIKETNQFDYKTYLNDLIARRVHPTATTNYDTLTFWANELSQMEEVASHLSFGELFKYATLRLYLGDKELGKKAEGIRKMIEEIRPSNSRELISALNAISEVAGYIQKL